MISSTVETRQRAHADRPLERIACIDDDVDILHIAQLALEEVCQLQVTPFLGAMGALRGIAAAEPDLILLDVMMPGLDGPATLRQLAQDEETASIPVVFMTARVQASEVRQYLAMGAIGVIGKPFDPITLGEELQGIWRSWRAGT